jgi:hypothetical protein
LVIGNKRKRIQKGMTIGDGNERENDRRGEMGEGEM